MASPWGRVEKMSRPASPEDATRRLRRVTARRNLAVVLWRTGELAGPVPGPPAWGRSRTLELVPPTVHRRCFLPALVRTGRILRLRPGTPPDGGVSRIERTRTSMPTQGTGVM